MIKKVIFKSIIFLSLVFISNCGYQAIYSADEINNFKIKEITLLGNSEINKNILSILNINDDLDKNNSTTLIFESSIIDNTTSKNSAGNPLTYQMILNTKLIVKNKEEIIKEQNFSSSFNYSNKENKFDLEKLRNEIKKNLSKTNADKILIFLKVRL